MFLAGVRDASLRTHTHIFLKPIKNQSAWRPVLGILTLLRVSASTPSYARRFSQCTTILARARMWRGMRFLRGKCAA